ncbi:MAG: microcin ABC transporter permease, partial [Oceanospirillales bacterium]|nr:microcin ABC transporter permease [Oceanospirillales bacterium]
MAAYIFRRLLLMIPTLFGILLLNFLIVQFAPGGPVEQTIAHLQGLGVDASNRIGSGVQSDVAAAPGNNSGTGSGYRGAQGLDPTLVAQIEEMYGFDKPAHERFFKMLGDYLSFDFGRSFYSDKSVVELIIEKMPVSIS